ncbi:oxidoreductase FAD/NAD(P)-binding domain protein [Alkaliphilus metalliredigens QYMF]|uniref:Dihydroorotate dehydrogenase B (NAD(+)), electron transfer subunit n=1 Tax=Alkaliphilus metalliredigens (strain QYMF) TaxID=293826 RepID=A6TVS1_ALKMQ|nr:dihydroorotate dehydrogenase electron transfer subunit [Alkaliphilus metalliredigens]ABR50289.1 oxidoreductase FAD/NAD(P)-binding domain protein [Alkaliphilus metalliredigens QYMF]
MKSTCYARIIEHIEIAPDMYKMVLSAEEIVKSAKVGQFVNIHCKYPGSLLPRPISICEIDPEFNTLTLVYAVLGKGTKALSQMMVGEEVEMIGPLGNGFMIPEDAKDHIVIGGGIGTPPLLELVKQLKGNIEVYLGFRCHPILVKTFEKYGAKVYVATEDGSVGTKGNVMDILKERKHKADMIYSCGPKSMLWAVAKWAAEQEIKAQVSMEERMACGIGACVGCTCKTKKKQDQDWQNKRVCKDGPVFWSDEVIWDD